MTTKTKNNLELWDEFKETNPKYTKSFSRPGGFKGTALDSMYQIMRLTEKFGPCGKGWGWEIIKEEYVTGGPLKKDPGVKAIIHKVELQVWSIHDGKKVFTPSQFGLTTFVGEYSTSGIFTDEEHAKKSVTDAVSKCASLMGLGADIFMGLYDDNKYVNDLKHKYAEGNGDKSKPQKNEKTTKAPPANKNGNYINEAKVILFLKEADKVKRSEDEVNKWLMECYGIEGIQLIPNSQFSEIKDQLKSGDMDIPF